jgi:transposase
MNLVLTEAQRAAVAAAAAREKRTRSWKRHQAVVLLAAGQSPPAVAEALGCCVASVYHWAARWRAAGVAGLAEGAHPGAARHVDAAGEAQVVRLLASDPQQWGHHATGWTVPLLRTELAAAGYAVSARTVRRTLHRLGYRWKRPQYVLGRPDPDYDPKKAP